MRPRPSINSFAIDNACAGVRGTNPRFFSPSTVFSTGDRARFLADKSSGSSGGRHVEPPSARAASAAFASLSKATADAPAASHRATTPPTPPTPPAAAAAGPASQTQALCGQCASGGGSGSGGGATGAGKGAGPRAEEAVGAGPRAEAGEGAGPRAEAGEGAGAQAEGAEAEGAVGAGAECRTRTVWPPRAGGEPLSARAAAAAASSLAKWTYAWPRCSPREPITSCTCAAEGKSPRRKSSTSPAGTLFGSCDKKSLPIGKEKQ